MQRLRLHTRRFAHALRSAPCGGSQEDALRNLPVQTQNSPDNGGLSRSRATGKHHDLAFCRHVHSSHLFVRKPVRKFFQGFSYLSLDVFKTHGSRHLFDALQVKGRL